MRFDENKWKISKKNVPWFVSQGRMFYDWRRRLTNISKKVCGCFVWLSITVCICNGIGSEVLLLKKLTFVQYIFIFVIWIYDQYILRTYETFSEKSNKILVSWKWQRVFFFLNEARRSWKRPYSISLCVYVFWYHKETQKWMIHFERSSRKSKFDSSVLIKTY